MKDPRRWKGKHADWLWTIAIMVVILAFAALRAFTSQ